MDWINAVVSFFVSAFEEVETTLNGIFWSD